MDKQPNITTDGTTINVTFAAGIHREQIDAFVSDFTKNLKAEGVKSVSVHDHIPMKTEIWIVHCLYCATGRSYIGIADGKKGANRLAKRLCASLNPLLEACNGCDFAITKKKVKQFNEMVIDLT